MNKNDPSAGFSRQELTDLEYALRLLERPSLAVKLADLLGRPVDSALRSLPDSVRRLVDRTARTALERALNVAVHSMGPSWRQRSRDQMYLTLSTVAGGVSGFAGLPGVAVELPVTTVMMMRSIMDIARSEGHDIQLPETRLACLAVFALGGTTPDDDEADTGYFAVRTALGKAVSDASAHLSAAGTAQGSAPALVRLISRIAQRFGITVSQKVAAQMIPVAGAVSGALVNSIFMDHYQTMARGHFILRRLEGRHGKSAVRDMARRSSAGSPA